MNIRGLFRSAGNFPIVRARDVQGGLIVVKSRSLRNAIPRAFRVLDANRTTLVYVEGGDLWRLINNPTTETTQDSDWQVAFQNNNGDPETLVGTWNVDNSDPVLTDAGALNRNGEYYFVRGAPNDSDVTITGLFEGETVTVKNGDMVVSAGTFWVVRRYDPQVTIPDELIVRQYVQDIAARNALDRWEGMSVVVKDAGGDPAVDSGVSAEYLYKPSSGDADGQGFVRILNPNLDLGINAGQVEFTPADQSDGSIWDGLLTAGATFVKNALDRIAVLLNPKAAVTTGAADAYEATIESVGSLVFGETITLKIHAANTGASTLDLNGGGAIAIKTQEGTDPAADDLPLNKLVSLFYDDTGTAMWVIKDAAVAASGGGSGGSNTVHLLAFNSNLTTPQIVLVDYEKTLTEELTDVSGVSYETYESGVDSAWVSRADIAAVNTEIGTWSADGLVRVTVSSVTGNVDTGFVRLEET